MGAVRTYLPWVRQGLVGLTATSDTLGPGLSGRARMPIEFWVNDTGRTDPDHKKVDLPLVLYGPGDVTGLDPREIIRTEPVHHATDFKPNYFPFIEFDRPDFPWLFTPAHADASNKLRPWLCLVIVKHGNKLTAAQPLPTLQCPVAELPDLNESWAWAHTQLVLNSKDEDPNTVLATNPERTLSRLVCPRHLEPNTAYYACVVPTFQAGVDAGLGRSANFADEQELQPAWVTGQADDVTLPVYFHWEFSTGPDGDFETLARRLQPRVFTNEDQIGLNKIDITKPGWGMPSMPENAAGGTVDLEGALRPAGVSLTTWPDDPKKTFALNLAAILNYRKDGEGQLVVIPPIYGSAHARRLTVPAEADKPQWLRDLNVDPRYRAAAGLGTLVIRFEQELLVASAWKQLAAHAREPPVQRRKELAGAITSAIATKHIVPLAGDTIAMNPSLLAAETKSLSSGLARPGEAAFRRLARPRGPLMRRLTNAITLSTAPSLRDSTPGTEASVSGVSAADFIRSLSGTVDVPRDGATGPSNGAVGTSGLLSTSEGTQQTLFAPQFPEPMYTCLRDYFPDFLLPGLENIPPDTVTLLETNPKFIEAFMVGLNHEMGRELLWREYPLDQRGTYFQRFWDNRSSVDDHNLSLGSIPPIKAWSDDSHLGDHLAHGAAAASGPEARPLALLIRGQLLRRYPRTIIYASQAEWATPDGKSRKPGNNERYPSFRANWGSDVTVLGFDLTDQEALTANGGLGWFFVIQQPPTEPGFGLDEVADDPSFGKPPATWSDLSWANLVLNASELQTVTHVDIGRLPSSPRLPVKPVDPGAAPSTQATWGRNSAHMAIIMEQTAFRLVIHASEWLSAQ